MTIAVMAHPSRATQATLLATTLNAHIIWDCGLGENDTGDRAWAWLHENSDDEWLTVIQDDAQPIDDFLTHLEAGIEHRPEDAEAFSWYLGTGRPPQWQDRITRALERLDGQAWLTADQLLHGVAVTLHRRHVLPMLEAVPHIRKQYDYRIGTYLRRNRRRVHYPALSLIDHADEDSLMGHNKAPRKAHRLGIPNWNTRTLPL